MNLAQFPRRGYVKQPTPIEFLPNFSKAMGNKVNVYIKRDDLLPGAAGGNKTRKLEFLMAEALEQGADTILTCGAVQSNHCRLTLAAAVKEGLKCQLILEERVKGSYNPQSSGNNFLFHLLGVEAVRVVPGGSDMLGELNKLADELRAQGRKPYVVPGGGSTPLGAMGYVSCAQEILQQSFEMGVSFDHIVCPSGSTGTHAGLISGLIGNNANIPLTGISVNRPVPVQQAAVYKLAKATMEKLECNNVLSEDKVVVFDDYVGPGYSLPTQSMVEAVQTLARTEAILMDPVYTGKTMAGFIDLYKKGYFKGCKNVLFVHTGGSPALYAYEDCILHGVK